MQKESFNIKSRFDRSRLTRSSQENQSQTRETNFVINEFDKDILVIRNYDDVKVQTLIAYDVVLLDYFKPTKASEMLSQIRASVYDEVYLKPVLISTHGNSVSPIDIEMADGVLNSNSIELVLDVVESISERTEDVLKVSSDFKGRKMLLKLMRFLYTRDRALKPIPTPKSHTGFALPFLDVNIKTEDYQELIDLLDSAEERGLVQADYEDSVHLCQNCNSGFINYRETCSKCDTHKFKSQHTIHHFVCGYVGPESDFLNGNNLECPKCDRQLRHIGVDYDKPSLVMECENGHIFQETAMKTFCFNCHTEAKPEDLITYAVNTYELTASGSDAAISGKVKEKGESQDLEGFVSLMVFKTFLKMEVERQRSTNKTSTVSYMNLMLCPKTIKKHQSDFSDFINEIARLIKSQLKSSEIVTFLNDEVFLIMSPEMSIDETSTRLEQIREHTKGMIRSACEGNKNDEIVFETFEVTTEEGTESVLDKINNQINIF